MKAIVFDLDGTLVDSLSLTLDAFNHVIESFTGKRASPMEIASHFGRGEGNILVKMLGRDKAETAYGMVRAYLDENMAKLPLHAGVGELLDRLKSAGVPISIFTGRSWGTTEIILKHHRILDRFVTVVADDHVSQSKPSPEGLLLALSRMSVDPAHAFFVGDSPMDVLAARSGGSQAVAALWDLMARRDALETAQPHHFAEKPGEVWEIWQKRAGGR